jgi:hypothetical protein
MFSYCSTCCCQRPMSDFTTKANGSLLKTCNRHRLKHSVERLFNSWDDLISKLQSHVRTESKISADMTFNLDNLPITFGTARSVDESTDNLDRAIHTLVKLVSKEVGFRFVRNSSRSLATSRRGYQYFCAQDEKYDQKSKSSGKRDVEKMTRFACQSALNLKV